jgi:DNA-directed RNA polymerase specialized sigma subunit
LDDEASPLSGSSIRAAVQDGPEALSAHLQDVERLGTALERLSSSERLLLALRFEQGLTLAEVARIGGLGDPFRARRAIDAALTSLRLSLEPDSQPADVPQELPVRP